jgi:cytoskeletal protein RodZ
MNFNGSGGLMFLIIAGLWVWVFVPSWFKRSEDRQTQRVTTQKVRGEIRKAKNSPGANTISGLAEQNFRLTLTRRIFTTIAFFAFAASIASIFVAVSQIFYWIVTFIFSAIFALSFAVARAAKKKSQDLLTRAARSRASIYAGSANAASGMYQQGVIAGNPVDIRDWEPNPLPAPKQKIGELETPTLAEVVEMDVRATKNASATLDSTALDEILRRRRANG